MPPVREASTKPSAATVLPAPVACSNQKRLAALGSSTASPAAAPRSSGVRRRTSRAAPRRARPRRAPRAAPPRPGSPRRRASAARRRRRRRCRARCRCRWRRAATRRAARSACRRARRPGGRTARCRRRASARPATAGGRGRAAATSGGATCSTGRVWPSASSFRTHSSATRRGIPGARDTDASSPSSRKGSRANASARSRSSGEGRGATARVAVSGSAMKARQIDVGGSRRYPPHGFELPDRNGEASSGRLPGKHPIFKQTASDGDAASATVCP